MTSYPRLTLLRNLLLVAALVLLLAACRSPSAPGEPQPGSSPIDRDEVRAIVQEAIKESSGLMASTEEIASIVEDALRQGPNPEMSEEQLKSVVEEAVKDAVEPGELIIYSGRSETLVDPIIRQFEEASGIEAKVKYAKTSQLATTLLEEGKNSPADVFFAQDPGGLGTVEPILAPLPEDIRSRVPQWAQSGEGRWVGISGRGRTVIYGTEGLTEDDLPDDMFGFTEPQWKGRIGWAPTNASFQTMVTAMRAIWGEDRAREWLEGIQANEPRVYPNNTPMVAAVAAGEVDVAFGNHYYLYRFVAESGEDFPARNYHPRAGGPGSIVMVAGAGILESAENRESAEEFLSFLLSTEGQEYFASETFEYPLVENVKVQQSLLPLSHINAPEVVLSDLSDLEGTLRLLQETEVLP